MINPDDAPLEVHMTYKKYIRAFRWELIQHHMKIVGEWNPKKVAILLGMERSYLYRILKAHGHPARAVKPERAPCGHPYDLFDGKSWRCRLCRNVNRRKTKLRQCMARGCRHKRAAALLFCSQHTGHAMMEGRP